MSLREFDFSTPRAHLIEQILLEYDAAWFRKNADPKRVARGKAQISAYYIKTDKDGTVHFKTPSGTGSGKYYTQRVRLVDLPKLAQSQDEVPDAVALAVKEGNVQMVCSCPDASFGGNNYILTHLDFKGPTGRRMGSKLGAPPENRFPKIRNPNLDGSGACKHLWRVLQVLPMNQAAIARDFGKFYTKVVK